MVKIIFTKSIAVFCSGTIYFKYYVMDFTTALHIIIIVTYN